MTANASSFMFPWSPSPRHTHTHGMFSPRMEFSRNGLCNDVKNKQARLRWRSRGPTVPMVVGAVMMKLKWVFQLRDGAALSRNELGYFRCKVPQTQTFELCVICCLKKSHLSSLKVHCKLAVGK
ncbi:hypothetical protein ACFXTO_046103 [Malus domestica]